MMKKRHGEKNKILLVNITRLGDMLQATPTIAGMKMENPNCHITVLVEKQFSEVCRYIPYIDEVFSLDLSMVVRAISREQEGILDAFDYLSEVVEDLRGRGFDYCLNMSSSAYTALLLNLIGIERNGGWTADDEGYRKIQSDWAKLFATSVFHQNRQYNSLNLVDVFRCSADVAQHPNHLCITVEPEAKQFADEFIRDAGFTNTGPIVSIQAGASQGKRQWKPANFIKLCSILVNEYNARVVMTGTKKELEIIDLIKAGVNSPNVVVAAGKTNIPQLAALLEKSEILVTGDTGPMHISAAVGTPVVAMFLASAYGFETGPYGEGHIVLQPVIGCGPCNPNKACSRPDCHDTMSPELIARLVGLRVREDIRELPDDMVKPHEVIIYRSTFDEFGFCNLEYMHRWYSDPTKGYRDAYRRLWLEELGGFEVPLAKRGNLQVIELEVEALGEVIEAAEKGGALIEELMSLIRNHRAAPALLGQVGDELTELDRAIEQIGYNHAPLGPLTRMFVFAKENLDGSDAVSLASQMRTIYQDLGRRGRRFGECLRGVASTNMPRNL